MAENEITAGVEGDALVIRVPLGLLVFASERAPFSHTFDPAGKGGGFSITDPVVFAESVAKRLLAEHSEEGAFIHEALDDAAEEVVEMDMPGWKWPRAGKQ